MKNVLLYRTKATAKQTNGTLTVFDENNFAIFNCVTLELPLRDNRVGVSCIPTGDYICERVQSPRLGVCYAIKHVVNRSHILIHVGNFNSEIRGCILIGQYLQDINNDKQYDTVNSRSAMNIFQFVVGRSFMLTIKD